MFNRKSSYALNKKDPNAIVYMDANEAIIRLTREDFASEEEFMKWSQFTSQKFEFEWFDGNHFYFRKEPNRVVDYFCQKMQTES